MYSPSASAGAVSAASLSAASPSAANAVTALHDSSITTASSADSIRCSRLVFFVILYPPFVMSGRRFLPP